MRHPHIRELPRATGGIARLAAARATAAGIGLGPLMRAAGLTRSEIDDEHARIGVAKQVAFLNLVAEALGDELLGFRLAQGFELRQIGLLYYVVASAPTLANALARAERYSTISNEGIVMRGEHGDCPSVRLSYVGVPRRDDRHQIEFWATALVRMARQVTGTNLRARHISFVHPRCAVSDRISADLGCPVEFGAKQDEIAFADGAGELPLTGADPYLHELLVEYCERALVHRRRPAEALRTRVENAITPLLPHGRAQAGAIARALGMSQRTFARRLKAEGLTFAHILDELRADLARHYLKDLTLSVSEIAWLLGFREVSAFSHAYKRWTGKTPTQARTFTHVRNAEARARRPIRA